MATMPGKVTEGKFEESCTIIDKDYSKLKYIYDRCSLVSKKANDVEFLSLKGTLFENLRSDQLRKVRSDYFSDLSPPEVSVTLGSSLRTLFTVTENAPSADQIAECSRPLQALVQKKSDNCLNNSSSNSTLLHEIGICKLRSDEFQPILSDVCWSTDKSFVVADTKNGKVKIFDDKGNSLWRMKAENVTNVACMGRFVVCNSNTKLFVYREGMIFNTIDFGPFSSGPFPIAQGLDLRYIFVGRLHTTFLEVYTTEGFLHKTIQLKSKISPICLRKNTECPIKFIDKTDKSIKDVSNLGNVTTFYSKKDCDPKSMVVDNVKKIYVIDMKTTQLLKISEDGKLIFVKDLPMDEPVGLSINSRNKCLVCEKTGKACFFKL